MGDKLSYTPSPVTALFHFHVKMHSELETNHSDNKQTASAHGWMSPHSQTHVVPFGAWPGRLTAE